MTGLKARRILRGLSQRRLADRAKVSFRTVQLLESGEHNWRLSSLSKVAAALGVPRHSLQRAIRRCLSRVPDSIRDASERICLGGHRSWMVHLFNFVDAFRRQPRRELVVEAPDTDTPHRIEALLASTVETLCNEINFTVPGWCRGVDRLPGPWFVSDTASLTALALVHSGPHYRKRNIFVLDNFLVRA